MHRLFVSIVDFGLLAASIRLSANAANKPKNSTLGVDAVEETLQAESVAKSPRIKWSKEAS